jgi:hypothetical protein
VVLFNNPFKLNSLFGEKKNNPLFVYSPFHFPLSDFLHLAGRYSSLFTMLDPRPFHMPLSQRGPRGKSAGRSPQRRYATCLITGRTTADESQRWSSNRATYAGNTPSLDAGLY